MEGKLPSKKEQSGEVINTQEQFFSWFLDARNQFFGIDKFLQKNPSTEEAKSFLSEFTFLPFAEYIATHNVSLSPEILKDEECKACIIVYDDLIQKLENFEDVKKLKQTFIEFENFIKK